MGRLNPQIYLLSEVTDMTGRNRSEMSRRGFLGGLAAGAAFAVVPRHVVAGSGELPPSEKLNIAGVGVGGMGFHNLRRLTSENIVALCDVDEKYAAKAFRKFPKARKWKDFRKMLDQQDEIEAVLIATPDHVHAVVSAAAMKHGKHVYTQKPLTHNVWEARKLRELADRTGVVTQMGNQGHSTDGTRTAWEWVRDGAIGPIREVHCWTFEPRWPQNLPKPKSQAVPGNLDWELWLGPARERWDYNEILHPGTWRGFWPYGTAGLGDQGCHVMDASFWALDLRAPTSLYGYPVGGTDASGPLAEIVHYDFPARGDKPPVHLTWYDGGLQPPKPPELGPDAEMRRAGTIFVGEKGKIVVGRYGQDPRILPDELMQSYDRPPQTLERVHTTHEMRWVEACKTDKKGSSHFGYAGPLAETVLLGNIAVRTGEYLAWDADNLKITNSEKANALVREEYRSGWSL